MVKNLNSDKTLLLQWHQFSDNLDIDGYPSVEKMNSSILKGETKLALRANSDHNPEKLHTPRNWPHKLGKPIEIQPNNPNAKNKWWRNTLSNQPQIIIITKIIYKPRSKTLQNRSRGRRHRTPMSNSEWRINATRRRDPQFAKCVP